MKGDLRCIDGRLFRHDPQWDDPYLETDVGECPDCCGKDCAKIDAILASVHEELEAGASADRIDQIIKSNPLFRDEILTFAAEWFASEGSDLSDDDAYRAIEEARM